MKSKKSSSSSRRSDLLPDWLPAGSTSPPLPLLPVLNTFKLRWVTKLGDEWLSWEIPSHQLSSCSLLILPGYPFLSKFSLEYVISDTVAHHFFIAHYMMLDTEYPSGVVGFVFLYIQTYSRIPFPAGSFHYDTQRYAKVKSLSLVN
jgi:hypothetical protein